MYLYQEPVKIHDNQEHLIGFNVSSQALISDGKQLSDIYDKVLTPVRSLELSWTWYRDMRQ